MNTKDTKDTKAVQNTKPVRVDHLILQIALLCGIMLTWLSIARYEGYNAGMRDLGNMAQSIWSGTQGDPLLHTAAWMGARSRLNVHVELVYYLLVPLYALFPDPRTILIVQAMLFVAGALPVYRIAMRRLDNRFAARCFALIYLFYPTAQTSVLWDFHGDTLAMPLLMFALDALDQRAWRRYTLFALLALSCKFYVALPLAGMGAYLFLWGVGNHQATNKTSSQQRQTERWIGILTTLVAIGYGAVAFLVVRPLFATPGLEGVNETSGWYLSHYFGELGEIGATFGDRLLSALVIFGPVFLLLGRGWRWLLPGLPIAFAMLITTGPGGAYDYRYHHYAIVVPFIIMAAIDSAGQMAASQQAARAAGKRRSGRNWRGDLVVSLVSVLFFNILLVDTPLNPFFWRANPGEGLDPSVYGITERDHVKDQFLAEAEARMPPDAPLVTSTMLAPHQINRETVYNIRYPEDSGAEYLPLFLPLVDYVMADALFDYYVPIDDTSYGGGVAYEREAIELVLRDPSFGLVAARDGLLLWERGASGDEVMVQQVEVVTEPSPGPLTMFGDKMSLIAMQFEQRTSDRLRVTFEWLVVGDTPPQQDYVAVSTLDGVEHNRIVHLPTYTLLPTSAWQPGQRIRETFDVDTSGIAPGEYHWRVGWYVLQSPYSYRTDERSLMPGSAAMIVGTVTVGK
jgi:uncharacterized membrane protein